MEYAYATCILNETNEEINEQNLTAVLEAAGAHVEQSRVKAIVAALEDVDVDDVTAIDVPEPEETTPNQASPSDFEPEGVSENGNDGDQPSDGTSEAVLSDGEHGERIDLEE